MERKTLAVPSFNVRIASSAACTATLDGRAKFKVLTVRFPGAFKSKQNITARTERSWSVRGKVNLKLGSVFKFQHEGSKFAVHSTAITDNLLQVHWVDRVVTSTSFIFRFGSQTRFSDSTAKIAVFCEEGFLVHCIVKRILPTFHHVLFWNVTALVDIVGTESEPWECHGVTVIILNGKHHRSFLLVTFEINLSKGTASCAGDIWRRERGLRVGEASHSVVLE
mmetsp:Transcript_5875/g.11788  ORF Transcript_5875/g.11788 Transcript_5875/m.11788 type:complete len:223 (-) Transcript_5875:306-974(-)